MSESVRIMRFKQAGGKDFLMCNGPGEQYLAGHISESCCVLVSDRNMAAFLYGVFWAEDISILLV